ncbi:hypothetical protein FRC10_002369 [Ceratobasidium sp. 414]|nr:hypothetical protein FRC10_002369 [Ceratobasidium sp. 414]
MGKTHWTPEEATWLETQISDWKIARVRRPQPDALNGRSTREDFLQSRVVHFQDRFPDRRWSDGDGRFATSAECHAWLYQKIEQWLKNRAREPGGRTRATVPRIRPFVTGRQLAMRICNSAIRTKAAEIRAETSAMNSRTAWNFATTEVMNDMRAADPSALADIERQARDVREAAARSYAEQDPDTLKE